ncbi:CD151 antigen-like [Parasteatoda tepidariorum]|uniref:CD151 antigen-like n=1 Tax=Parasteatoda tepidariorum TaxID=114398 RepID=UPI00077FE2F6|nr:CD151 antigen-like [Parasteatoda tepidariorum]
MALSCGAKCAKGVLIAFNLIFWLSGCALIAFGIYMLIEEEKTTLFRLFSTDDYYKYSNLQYLSFALILIGGLVFIVGFFGCCGAMQENKCMLVVYFLFLFIILAAELAVGVLAILFQDKEMNEMEGKLKEKLKQKYGSEIQFTQAVDFAQTKFNCCGVRDGGDYSDSIWKQRSEGRNVSPTCCTLKNAKQADAYLNPQPLNESLCQKEDSNSQYRHQTGCKMKLEGFFRNESMLFIAIGCGVAVLEIFGMIFSVCLCREI